MDAVAGAGPATVRLAFPPEPRLLGTVRLVVGIVARKAGMGAEGIEDLKVAVSETCAVAVGDLTRAGLPHPIEIDLVEGADRLGIEVRDRAPATARSTTGSSAWPWWGRWSTSSRPRPWRTAATGPASGCAAAPSCWIPRPGGRPWVARTPRTTCHHP